MSGRLLPEEVSTLNDTSISSSGFESTKNYVYHALEREFNSRLEASGIEGGLGGADPNEELKKLLQLKLQIERTQSENQGTEIQELRSSFNQALISKQWEYQYKRKNVYTGKNSTLELMNLLTKDKSCDTETLVHVMVTRIKTLTRENQKLTKMLEYGRAKEIQIQLQLAQIEHNEVNRTISELKRPKSAP